MLFGPPSLIRQYWLVSLILLVLGFPLLAGFYFIFHAAIVFGYEEEEEVEDVYGEDLTEVYEDEDDEIYDIFGLDDTDANLEIRESLEWQIDICKKKLDYKFLIYNLIFSNNEIGFGQRFFQWNQLILKEFGPEYCSLFEGQWENTLGNNLSANYSFGTSEETEIDLNQLILKMRNYKYAFYNDGITELYIFTLLNEIKVLEDKGDEGEEEDEEYEDDDFLLHLDFEDEHGQFITKETLKKALDANKAEKIKQKLEEKKMRAAYDTHEGDDDNSETFDFTEKKEPKNIIRNLYRDLLIGSINKKRRFKTTRLAKILRYKPFANKFYVNAKNLKLSAQELEYLELVFSDFVLTGKNTEREFFLLLGCFYPVIKAFFLDKRKNAQAITGLKLRKKISTPFSK